MRECTGRDGGRKNRREGWRNKIHLAKLNRVQQFALNPFVGDPPSVSPSVCLYFNPPLSFSLAFSPIFLASPILHPSSSRLFYISTGTSISSPFEAARRFYFNFSLIEKKGRKREGRREGAYSHIPFFSRRYHSIVVDTNIKIIYVLY